MKDKETGKEERPITPSEDIAENKSWISRAISAFVTTDRDRLSEIFSLLLSRRSVPEEVVAELKNFYAAGADNRRIFFRILSGFSQKRVELILEQIYATTDSPLWVVEISAELTDEIKGNAANYQDEELKRLRLLRKNFQTYLGSIFNLQYLNTRIYNADNTPVTILKYIAQNEGVHPASHWSAFEERFNSPDRILLGLEHFKIPNHPVVYVEMALSDGLLTRISDVLGEDRHRIDPAKANTGIFYSVNNTFRGLSGVGLGERIILKAKGYLQQTYPHLKNFATLSPIPDFRRYLKAVLKEKETAFDLKREVLNGTKKNPFFTKKSIVELSELLEIANPYETAGAADAASEISDFLYQILENEDWMNYAAVTKHLEKGLVSLTRHYLTSEKRRDPGTGKATHHAYDPVANFHLSNGASIGSINFMANPSPIGLESSYGMMVNYIYDDSRLEKNKLKYSNGEIDLRI